MRILPVILGVEIMTADPRRIALRQISCEVFSQERYQLMRLQPHGARFPSPLWRKGSTGGPLAAILYIHADAFASATRSSA